MNLAQQLARLRAEIEWARSLDWDIPEPPEAPPGYNTSRLKPLTSTRFDRVGAVTDRDDIRGELAQIAHEFIMNEEARGLMLVNIPAGVGKTYGLSLAAQAAAMQGGRAFWAAQDHGAWHDLEGFKHFRPSKWLHWQGLGRSVDGEPMCRYAFEMEHWITKGYKARDLCTRLCLRDGWMSTCPYQLQGQNNAGCVFGMHAHLIYGLPGAPFTLAIVDELPIKAFVKERVIPWRTGILRVAAKLEELGLYGPGADLIQALVHVSYQALDHVVSGRELFDMIGPVLDDVHAALEVGMWRDPQPPYLSNPTDVLQADYHFLPDLIMASAIGHTAWRAGWGDWAHRVWCDHHGLHMLGRHGLWEDLPKKVIVLDATGERDLYELLFRTAIYRDDGSIMWARRKTRQVYAPRIKRVGQLYQITGRLYSKRSLYRVTKEIVITHEDGKIERTQEIEVLPKFHELVETLALLVEKHKAEIVGVITYQAIEEKIVTALTERTGAQVLSRHFYFVRGTNSLEKSQVLFVVGSPTPAPSDLIKLGTALNPARRLPFIEFDAAGNPEAIYINQVAEYRLTQAALAETIRREGWDTATLGAGRVVGMYIDRSLRTIHRQLRAAEVLQAAHRGRINIQDVPVYVFTNTTMLDEPLDGVYNEVQIGPHGIHLKNWLKLKAWLGAQATGKIATAADLAAEAGVSERYVAQFKWITKIAAYYAALDIPAAEKWSMVQLLQQGRGRKPHGLSRNN